MTSLDGKSFTLETQNRKVIFQDPLVRFYLTEMAPGCFFVDLKFLGDIRTTRNFKHFSTLAYTFFDVLRSYGLTEVYALTDTPLHARFNNYFGFVPTGCEAKPYEIYIRKLI